MGEYEKVKQKLLKIIIILIVVAVVVISMFLGLVKKKKMLGNASGNLANFGYSVEKGNDIYYVALDEKMEKTNIYKTNVENNETQEIFQGEYDIRSLNIVGDNLYFVNVKLQEEPQETDNYTINEICKINLDGSEFAVLNGDQVTNSMFDMYVIAKEIYYVGEDLNIYKMNLNGEKRVCVQETQNGFLTMNEKYIIYNKENQESGEFITYINELKKDNEKAINGSEIYKPYIYQEDIYYLDNSQQLVRISIENGQETVIDDMVYNLNLYDHNIFYLKQQTVENQEEEIGIGIYKFDLKMGESSLVKEISYYTSFINVVNGYIYYMDIGEESTAIKLLNVENLEEVVLCEWRFEG